MCAVGMWRSTTNHYDILHASDFVFNITAEFLEEFLDVSMDGKFASRLMPL